MSDPDVLCEWDRFRDLGDFDLDVVAIVPNREFGLSSRSTDSRRRSGRWFIGNQKDARHEQNEMQCVCGGEAVLDEDRIEDREEHGRRLGVARRKSR